MNDQRQTAESLFGAALELPCEHRQDFLARACGNNEGLRALVEHLLREHERAGSFLERQLIDHAANSASIGDATYGTADVSASMFWNPARFSVSQVIAKRFVVVRFIARGGMGEVYEVEDQLLQNARVALKIIRPEIAADTASAHRFEQEVLLARKVTHPNLCPIYEIFHCEEPAPPFLFLTMKLLRGEVLGLRLSQTNPVSREEASQICADLIAGVAAMHAAGIVHRDIKPNNVMLEHTANGLNVSIMDFGLARLYETEQTLAKSGMIAGTPGYLAPELLHGHYPSRATDIFALGVVLHQVLTGRRPVAAPDGISLLPADDLKTANAPASVVEAVAEFLSDDPQRRCTAFDRLQTSGSRERPLLTRRRFLIAASASAVAISGGVVWDRHAIYNFLHPLPSKRFVALLGWPPPPDIRLKPMLLSLIDAMATELSRAEAFDSNFFVTTQQFTTELKTPTQVNEVRESLGANLVLAASGSTVDRHYLVHLNVLDPESLHVLRSRELRAPIDQQFSLPVQAVHAAAELLGIPSYGTSDHRSQAGTKNAQALSAFQNAQALMKQPNNAGLDAAIEQYKEAVEEDSHYAIAYARLSIAYLRLYTAHRDPISMTLARANAETAIALDPDAVDGRLALGSVYQMTGNEKEALHQLGLALRVDPADIRTMTYQAQIYSETNQWDEAEHAFNRILKARPNNWVVYNELGNNYYYQGKFPQALEAFRAAAATGPRNAMAYENIGLTYSAMGNFDEAMKAIQKSLSISPMDAAYQTKADLLRSRGQYAEALQSSIEATRIDPEESTNWLEVGDSYASLRHRKQEALAAYKKAADAQIAELEVNPDDGPGWMLLALYRAKTGDGITSPTLIKKAESLNAIDIFSQLYKVRTLEILGNRKDALTALAPAVRQGLTRYQVEGIHDLDLLRADPKYPGIMAAGPGS